MEKSSKILRILPILLCVMIAQNVLSYTLPPKPEPAVYVNDYAGLFTSTQKESLEYKLIRYYDSTSTQIVVIIPKSLEGADASEYAINLGHQWGVGQADNDNGVVFLVAPNERKMFIATGYGVEERLTDAFLSRIRRNYIFPYFKNEQYFEGINVGIDLMIDRLSGKYTRDDDEIEPLH